MRGQSYLITSGIRDEIARNIPPSMGRLDAVDALLALYDASLTPLLDQIRDQTGRGGLGIVEESFIDVYALIPGLHELERYGTAGSCLVERGFLDTLVRSWDLFSARIRGLVDDKRRGLFASIVSEKCTGISYQMIQAYITNRSQPFSYDPFDDSMLGPMAWFLGALACEGSIPFQDGTWARVRVGFTNPLIFFQKALPLVRHPSMQSAEMTFSPAFVASLRSAGIIKNPARFCPVKMPDEQSRRLFLAGLLDTRSVLCYDKKGKRQATKFRAVIDVPFDAVNAWLDLIPVAMPILVSQGIEISPGNREKFHPVVSMADKLGAILQIFGRRFNEDALVSDEDEARILAMEIKYIYEHILPLCVHPRVAYFFELAMYLEDEPDTEPDDKEGKPSFSKLLRTAIKDLKGIDTSMLQDNFKYRVLDPETGEVWLFLPPWLRDFMKKRNITEADLIQSCQLSGGFVPFPRAMYYSPLMNHELPQAASDENAKTNEDRATE